MFIKFYNCIIIYLHPNTKLKRLKIVLHSNELNFSETI